MSAPRLDHIGIAVRSIAERLPAWVEALGLPAPALEEVPTEKVRVAFLDVGGARLELLEPLAEDCAIGRALARRGEGIHHICLAVDDLDAALARLESLGVPLVDRVPRPGAGGSRVAFLQPRGMGGVLVELKEARRS